MSKLPPELIDKMRRSIEDHARIQNLLAPLGLHLCAGHVYFGEGVCRIYCGKSEDYQKIIDNLSDINEIATNVSYDELCEIVLNRTLFDTVEVCRPMIGQLSFNF